MLAVTALAIAAAAAPHAPDIHAHRGGSFVAGHARYAEATMPAFRAAAKRGDVLEFDIQMSADGVPMVMHDDTLDRTTVCTGPVSARTAADIQAACPTDVLGSPGSALGGKTTSKHARVPTLDQVLALVKRTRSHASIELKQFDPDGGTANALAAAIRTAGIPVNRIIVQSFFPPNLVAMAKALPGVATSTLTLQVAEGTSIESAKSSGSAWVSPEWPVSKAYVRQAHAAGLKVVPWTLDRASEVRAAARAGVDAVITDDAKMATRVLKKLRR
jgi:glycerophosphoryl diester phosphodiesterase